MMCSLMWLAALSGMPLSVFRSLILIWCFNMIRHRLQRILLLEPVAVGSGSMSHVCRAGLCLQIHKQLRITTLPRFGLMIWVETCVTGILPLTLLPLICLTRPSTTHAAALMICGFRFCAWQAPTLLPMIH